MYRMTSLFAVAMVGIGLASGLPTWAEEPDGIPLKGALLVEPSHPNVAQITIEGKAAQQLFQRIKGKGTRDECRGGVAKQQGLLDCIKYDGKDGYACFFNLDATKGALVSIEEDC